MSWAEHALAALPDAVQQARRRILARVPGCRTLLRLANFGRSATQGRWLRAVLNWLACRRTRVARTGADFASPRDCIRLRPDDLVGQLGSYLQKDFDRGVHEPKPVATRLVMTAQM